MSIIRAFTDMDDDGADGAFWPPTISNFANALQIWSFAQDHRTTISEAAQVFNIELDLVRHAVEYHYWMFLDGEFIEHEGE